MTSHYLTSIKLSLVSQQRLYRYRLYDTVDYYWTILLMNNIEIDFMSGTLAESQFEEYVNANTQGPS